MLNLVSFEHAKRLSLFWGIFKLPIRNNWKSEFLFELKVLDESVEEGEILFDFRRGVDQDTDGIAER